MQSAGVESPIWRSEQAVHPHCPEERAGEFQTLDAGSLERETAEFVYGLVRLFKPRLALETGTGSGVGSWAIATALQSNASGHLHTVEIDLQTSERAREFLSEQCPEAIDRVTFQVLDSSAFIDEWPGPPFEFALFDSLIPLRHREFQALLDRNMLAPKAICVFHDTSRLRGLTMHDFDPEMIAALDRASQGRQWLECELSRGLRVLKLD